MFEGDATAISGWAEVVKSAVTVIGSIVIAYLGYLVKKRSDATKSITKPDEPLELPEPDIHGSFSGVMDKNVREAFERLDKRITASFEAIGKIDSNQAAIIEFRNAVWNIDPVARWVSNHKGEFTFVSKEMARLVGLDRTELLNNGWVQNLAPGDKSDTYDEWLRAVRQKRGFSAEFEFIHKGGKRVKVSAEAIVVNQNGGQVYIGVLTEIKDGKDGQ